MYTKFRNPHTPTESEVFTPQAYLKRVLEFETWDHQYTVKHLPICDEESYYTVRNHGLCCIQHLKECIEGVLLNLAGCRTGVFIEPKGYQNWLTLANKRLEELQDGNDYLEGWTEILNKFGLTLNDWVHNPPKNQDRNLEPGFSLQSFCVACQKYGYTPDFADIAYAFHRSVDQVASCWTENQQ